MNIGGGDEKISVIRAFDAMRWFLEDYWNRGGKRSDDIAVLLGSLNRDETQNELPLDPGLWDDWTEAVKNAYNSHDPGA